MEPATDNSNQLATEETNAEMRGLQKLLRYFMRSSQISDALLLAKLEARARGFITPTLPKLLRHGIIAKLNTGMAATCPTSKH